MFLRHHVGIPCFRHPLSPDAVIICSGFFFRQAATTAGHENLKWVILKVKLKVKVGPTPYANE